MGCGIDLRSGRRCSGYISCNVLRFLRADTGVYVGCACGRVGSRRRHRALLVLENMHAHQAYLSYIGLTGYELCEIQCSTWSCLLECHLFTESSGCVSC